MQGIAAQRIAVRRDVRCARTVARLAGDAELGRRRVHDLRVERLPSRRACRTAVCRGWHDRRYRCCSSGRFQRTSDCVGGCSTAIRRGIQRCSRDQIRAWQLTEQPVATGRIPVDLLMVRAGDHHHLALDARPRVGRSLESGSSNSAQSCWPRSLRRIGRPCTAATVTPSKLATAVSGVAACVMVR